ncbi:carboxylesterase/lipase family protein [Streptomyces turgidiscabies]|uniref:Carboxylic ester hydrolase n=1 Tax=Streptomyces turgidiscabies (strain Car8) TaxID=698760 RepID=L7EXI7_STRT8|nr:MULTISPECIES: carboxylesterase family protein [Streptomyces]ELP63777.1 putative para-nitrobenzyl esterase [Streptomyces turgidiscabies Car8]MDX3491754.1 carboxylesterase family protein [Streptomyces turgidiscabies]GAQ72130.1 carboxylesterase [Streptomyces turgidiscabies]
MSTGEFPEVRTAAGAVRGRWQGGLAVFRGIPFAEPPVGELRFAAPRRAASWDGVREAFAFGPPPPQEVTGPGTSPAGDDWLTVNVWTPDADPAARRPVMVWIYGGAYKLGSADDPNYDGGRLSREGDVVVVTLNYRVGIEGFARIEGAPANRGLLDQVAALEWVRENVSAFGGDPGQVTVFGESAGAGSVAALLVMPRARGLFRRAIAQSVPGTYFSDALAGDIAGALAGELGLRPTVADLAAVDPRKLPEAGAALSARMLEHVPRWGAVALTPTPFSPVVDGDVLPTAPWEALAGGAARDVDLIVGHTRDEYRLFLMFAGLFGRVDEEMAASVLRVFGPGPEAEQAYRAAFPDASAEYLFELVQSDWLFRMPSLHLAQAQVAGGGRAHVYELTWSAPVNGGALGACHGLDVPLTFGNFGDVAGGLGGMLVGPIPSSGAEAVSARFRSAWTSFAATGDPGWPAYDTERRLVLLLDTEPSVAAYPEEASRRLWEGHTFGVLPLTAE